MRYEILLSPQAIADVKALAARARVEVRHAIELHLRHELNKLSRSRVKRLRGLSRPQFRLRVGDIRVFYDVSPSRVHVLTVVTKEQAELWLAQHGVPQ